MAATRWTSTIPWYRFVILAVCALSKSFAAAKGENNGCSDVKIAYGAKGFNHHEVPGKMMSGWHLKICPQGFTCCTGSMEEKLDTRSKQEFDKIMSEKISLVRETFISRTAKFDAFFTELLENSKRDLHDMFVRTYGLLYQQNSYVFTDLFEDLRNYYKGKDVNLLDALDNFFTTLLQKMFQLLNAQYEFDDTYMQCVTDHMDDLKPFGDVPHKLSIQVKRAFIAARTFVQGLIIGREVILEVSKLKPSLSCRNAVMKMLYCPYCKGLPNTLPCNNFCINVMKGCLAYHAEVNKEWNNYIDAMMKLAERLEGPFNIESVVDPIDVKISDAIMNFQEHSETVSTKVFQGCGQPTLGRHKREAAASDEITYDWKYERKDSYVRPTTAAGTSLDRLVRDIKQKVEVAKDFWKSLPHTVCNDIAAPVYEETNCWNGLGKSRYIPEVLQDGVVNQNNNPEVEVDVRKPNSMINQQILQLQIITGKLKNAYNGVEVEYIDTGDAELSGSGSGSGSGFDVNNVNDDGISFTYSTRRPVVITRKAPGSIDRQPESAATRAYFNSIILVLPILLLTGYLHRFC